MTIPSVDPKRIRLEVAPKLGYYVYAYVDPLTSRIFYVGKGCRSRVLAHVDETGESEKHLHIAELKRAGLEPRIDIVAHGIADEKTALRIEAAVIDTLWPERILTNKVRGHNSLEFGRVDLRELEALYSAKPVTITEPSMLIRINQLYRPGMSAVALYEATRGVWTCGLRREQAKYAFAVYQGVIREAYHIDQWHKAGTLPYHTRQIESRNRWEFSGTVDDGLSAKYRNGSVDHYFSKGAQLPFTYVEC